MNPLYRDSPVVKSFLAGSISGGCSTILFQPLDLLKTRLQSVTEVKQGSGKIFVIYKSVLKKDGVSGLWRGLTPSLLRTVPGIGIYFSSLHLISKVFGSSSHVPHPLESLLTGAAARSLTSCATVPLSLVKTRFESGFFAYKGIAQALNNIYSLHGFRGLFLGLSAMMARDIPFSGLYLMFYNQAKQSTEHIAVGGKRAYVLFCCGVTAGIMASVVTHPFDVIKTHQQLYPDRYVSTKALVQYIYKTFGVGGLFLGLVPRLMRRTLMAAMSWTLYEQLMVVAKLK